MRRRFPISLGVAALLALAMLAGAAQSARALAAHAPCTIYASPGGHGSGAATGSPASLGSAVARARAGSVICLEPGTYLTHDNVTLEHSGAPGAPITLTGLSSGVLIRYVGG